MVILTTSGDINQLDSGQPYAVTPVSHRKDRVCLASSLTLSSAKAKLWDPAAQRLADMEALGLGSSACKLGTTSCLGGPAAGSLR